MAIRHQVARDARPVGVGDGEVFPRGKLRYQSRGHDHQKKVSPQQEQQNQGDEDRRRDDPFHNFKQAYTATAV